MTRAEKYAEKYPETSTFHYYNANPKKRITGDCWLRAICTGLNRPYNDVLKEMVDVHLETGYEMSCDKAIDRYLASQGWVKHKQPKHFDGTKFTGEQFCISVSCYLRHGIKSAEGIVGSDRIIANIGGHHMVAIVDGKINDIWDSTYKCIGNYWTKG